MPKWFKKKNKTELFVSYIPLETAIYLKIADPERLNEVREDTVFPFFIELIQEPFKNWVIELTEVKEDGNSISFGTMIHRVPKNVTEKEIDKSYPKLKRLLSKVVNDIIGHAIENAKQVISEHEKIV